MRQETGNDQCLDELTLQALVDQELDMAMAELLLHHVGSCPRCAATLRKVKQRNDFCAEQLGREDETRAEESAVVLRRVWGKLSIHAAAPRLSSKPRGAANRWWRRGVMVAASLLLAILVPYHYRQSGVASADEVLKRAEAEAVNARTLPGRIVHQHWREKLEKGYGPLPDGEYASDYWWDNAENRRAILRYDHKTHALVEGHWILEDAVVLQFLRNGADGPRLITGPSASEVLLEIEKLPLGTREKMRAIHRWLNRPGSIAAAEARSRLEEEILQQTVNERKSLKVQETKLADGRDAYLVSFHSVPANPDSRVKVWETSWMILKSTFTILKQESLGRREDGQIYVRQREMVSEEVYFPAELRSAPFTPGPFPPGIKRIQISASERVRSILGRIDSYVALLEKSEGTANQASD